MLGRLFKSCVVNLNEWGMIFCEFVYWALKIPQKLMYIVSDEMLEAKMSAV